MLVSLAGSMPRGIATAPGREASPSQGYPPAVCGQYPFTNETTRRARLKRRTYRSGVRGVNHSPTHTSTVSLHAKR